jgi:hypothetical protein
MRSHSARRTPDRTAAPGTRALTFTVNGSPYVASAPTASRIRAVKRQHAARQERGVVAQRGVVGVQQLQLQGATRAGDDVRGRQLICERESVQLRILPSEGEPRRQRFTQVAALQPTSLDLSDSASDEIRAGPAVEQVVRCRRSTTRRPGLRHERERERERESESESESESFRLGTD